MTKSEWLNTWEREKSAQEDERIVTLQNASLSNLSGFTMAELRYLLRRLQAEIDAKSNGGAQHG